MPLSDDGALPLERFPIAFIEIRRLDLKTYDDVGQFEVDEHLVSVDDPEDNSVFVEIAKKASLVTYSSITFFRLKNCHTQQAKPHALPRSPETALRRPVDARSTESDWQARYEAISPLASTSIEIREAEVFHYKLSRCRERSVPLQNLRTHWMRSICQSQYGGDSTSTLVQVSRKLSGLLPNPVFRSIRSQDY